MTKDFFEDCCTTRMDKLMELGKKLLTSQSEEEFRQAIECAADFMGAFVYNAMAFDSDKKGTDGKGLDNIPAIYDANDVIHNVGEVDPVMQHCRVNSSPIIWDQSIYIESNFISMWEHTASYGMPQGIDLALHLGKHRHFLLGFIWNSSKPLSQREKINATVALQALAVFAEPTAFRLWHPVSQSQYPEPEIPLSHRERECLYWVSRGMTDDLIARVLAISARTVRKHVDSCMQKLSAANRTEAAVLGTRLGFTDALPST